MANDISFPTNRFKESHEINALIASSMDTQCRPCLLCLLEPWRGLLMPGLSRHKTGILMIIGDSLVMERLHEQFYLSKFTLQKDLDYFRK